MYNHYLNIINPPEQFENADTYFNNDDLKQYDKFKNILINFQKLYGIEEYNLKDLDRYLWQLGKEKFPNKY